MTQIISIAQRHKYILDKLKKDGYIRVADIAKSLKVTAVTVRKDFKALEEQGLLFRTHGSACPVNPHVADRRAVQLKELENRVQKEKIAQAATQLLEENDSVIIATGSTIMAFAEKIVPKGTLNVVTPSLKVSMLLSAVGTSTSSSWEVSYTKNRSRYAEPPRSSRWKSSPVRNSLSAPTASTKNTA